MIIAAKLGINILAPSAANFLPDWVPQFTVGKNYPSLSSITDTSLAEASEEWQHCVADILEDNDGLTDHNIAQKFLLKRATSRNADGSNHKEHQYALSSFVVSVGIMYWTLVAPWFLLVCSLQLVEQIFRSIDAYNI